MPRTFTSLNTLLERVAVLGKVGSGAALATAHREI